MSDNGLQMALPHHWEFMAACAIAWGLISVNVPGEAGRSADAPLRDAVQR